MVHRPVNVDQNPRARAMMMPMISTSSRRFIEFPYEKLSTALPTMRVSLKPQIGSHFGFDR
jgi:hypothetical protein